MCDECQRLFERVQELERLVMAMGDKLLIVAEHLGRLAERKECRNGQGHRPRTDGSIRDLQR